VSQSDSPPLSPIGETLRRVTDELRKVTRRLERVDNAVGRLVFDSASPRGPHFHDLQDLDRAKQEVAGIAGFLERLARDMPAEWVADSNTATLLIDLHDLAASLAMRDADESDAEPGDTSDCEMFGT
jgi:hypothetical protein